MTYHFYVMHIIYSKKKQKIQPALEAATSRNCIADAIKILKCLLLANVKLEALRIDET